ncbi:MAG: hypothetical protein JNJ57_01165 [Saprospiraceae bacterium]|nr:hypothetical protein [Saprospiraceae bacterium]
MEAILPYLINTALGAGGGYLGNMLKKNGLGMIGNLLAGAVGGNALPLILQQVMGGGADGGNNMIMQIVSALLGGGLGSVIGGLFKKPAG